MTHEFMTTNEIANENNLKDFSKDIPLFESSDLLQKLIYLELWFDKTVCRIQSTWKHIDLINLNECDKKILINALPGLEALFLEKLRLSWMNFKTRFQQQMTCNISDYNSFHLIILSIENQLLEIDSMLMDCNSLNTIYTDKLRGYGCDEKSYVQLFNKDKYKDTNVLNNQIKLPNK